MDTKEQILKQYFGYDSFRDGQGELVDAILEGRDVFGIMPTGAGKSICYQVPALMLPGITLVISPLISLMKDQVTALNQAGIYAAFLNSSLTQNQYFKALQYAYQGKYKIIYVAPERLLTDSFMKFAQSESVEISMVSVDEAHCVSQWGQDFRPSYLKITEFIHRLNKRPIVSAFTATATDLVKKDIVKILELENPQIVATGFDRPNLKFVVEQPRDKYGFVSRFVREHDEANGIIYCISRKLVEEVCQKLSAEGYQVTRYHAGLSDAERKQNQEDFIFDRTGIMVATNAFGMGIDKSDVRYVIHYNMPKDLESYYQEAGRAGRDGGPAECILLYSGQDVRTNEFFIDNNRDNEELDAAALLKVQERDRERLKKMTFYCHTTDCLREYILKYFGEYQGSYCGNCSNCLTTFEEVDITEAAKHLISCVQECDERYGSTMIIDIVHGGSSDRIKSYHLDRKESYGTEAVTSIVRLKKIMQYLIMEKYLQLSTGEYQLVLLTEKGVQFLTSGELVLMKMAKETELGIPKLRGSKGKSSLKKLSDMGYAIENEELFQKLRELRSELAHDENVPAYVIFTDKTLIDMSNKRPRSREEMLDVSGVAQAKFERYGSQFLRVIENYYDALPPVRVKWFGGK